MKKIGTNKVVPIRFFYLQFFHISSISDILMAQPNRSYFVQDSPRFGNQYLEDTALRVIFESTVSYDIRKR